MRRETVTSLTLWRRAICAAVFRPDRTLSMMSACWTELSLRRRQAGPGLLTHHGPLELGEGADHLHHHSSKLPGCRAKSSPPNPVLQGSVTLELTQPMPVFIGPPLGTSLLLPQHVGTLTEMLVESAVPVFVRSPFRTAFLFPKEVGTFTDGLFQAGYRF
jgi:hypothetical protein